MKDGTSLGHMAITLIDTEEIECNAIDEEADYSEESISKVRSNLLLSPTATAINLEDTINR